MNQLAQIWQSMSPGQRLRLGIMLAVIAVGTVLVVVWALKPTYALLYSDLAPEDAAAIADFLREQKVPYRLVANGTAIMVPEDKVYQLRLQTVSKGLIGKGTVGFEIFDRATLPGTDFANRVNLQRALQGELSRTIASMAEVASARVHIVLPEKTLFGEEQPPRASVLLVLKGGATLSREQVRGIQLLVAHAVEGLDADNVTVIDSRGNVLAGGEEGEAGLSAAQLEAKAEYEKLLRSRLQAMLDSLVGPNKSTVQVHTQMVFDKEEVEREEVVPASGGQGVLRQEKTLQETYRGGAPVVGGAAGVSANVYGQGAGGASRGGGQYTHTEQTREYEVSRTVTRTIKPPGKVTRITVAAIVDESVKVDTAQIRRLLEAAVGADPSRGDVVEVQRLPLEASKLAEQAAKEAEKAQAAERRARIMRMVMRWVGLLALAVVLGGFMWAASRQIQRAAAPQEGEGEGVEAGEPALPVEEQGGGEGTEQPAPALPEVEGEQAAEAEGPSEAEQLEAKLQEYARNNSRAFAAQLRVLLRRGELKK